MPTESRTEHLEDFTAHSWCKALFSDPSIIYITDRRLFSALAGWNRLFTHGLWASESVRAFIDLYNPGHGQKRTVIDNTQTIVTHTSIPWQDIVPPHNPREATRQTLKQDIHYPLSSASAPSHIVLVSLGNDVDGNVNSLHGGVMASLMDHCMGSLVLKYYGIGTATTELKVTYKKNVDTPCVVMTRARIVREKGRWVEVRSWVEDGRGMVFAEGWGGFVKNKATGEARM